MENKLSLLLIFSFIVFGCESSELEDPTTVISFSIPEESHVKLFVTNTYDAVVITLIDGILQPGIYSAPFQMNELASGTYYFTIETTGVSSGKKYKATQTFYLVK